jgi:putative flippase GtrA
LNILGISLPKLIRFAAGGVLSSAVTLGVTALLREVFGIREAIAAAVGLASAMLVNFVFLRHFVFASRATPIARQLAMFLTSNGVFRAFEYLGFLVVLGMLDLHYLLSLLLVLGVSFLFKFVVYERLVFTRRDAAAIQRGRR